MSYEYSEDALVETASKKRINLFFSHHLVFTFLQPHCHRQKGNQTVYCRPYLDSATWHRRQNASH